MKLVSPLAAVFASLVASSTPAIGADAASSPEPAKPKPPLITRNADGTMTVQKEEASEDAGRKGLVIHPQVVAPTARGPKP